MKSDWVGCNLYTQFVDGFLQLLQMRGGLTIRVDQADIGNAFKQASKTIFKASPKQERHVS